MSRICGTCVGAGLLLFAVGCGGGGATPEAAFKEFQAAVKAKDGDKAWNLLSKDAQSQMEVGVKTIKALLEPMFKQLEKATPAELKAAEEKMGMTLAEFKALDAKGFFTLGLKKADKAPQGKGLDEIASATLENVKVEGDKATGTVKTANKSVPIQFVKEGGSWKIMLPAPK
jgi:hypothetical protein